MEVGPYLICVFNCLKSFLRNSSPNVFCYCERHSKLQKRGVHPFEMNTKERHSSSLPFLLLTGQMTQGSRPSFLVHGR